MMQVEVNFFMVKVTLCDIISMFFWQASPSGHIVTLPSRPILYTVCQKSMKTMPVKFIYLKKNGFNSSWMISNWVKAKCHMFLCLFQGLGFLCLTIVTIFAEFPGVEGSLHAYKSMLGAGNRRQILCESSKNGNRRPIGL